MNLLILKSIFTYFHVFSQISPYTEIILKVISYFLNHLLFSIFYQTSSEFYSFLLHDHQAAKPEAISARTAGASRPRAPEVHGHRPRDHHAARGDRGGRRPAPSLGRRGRVVAYFVAKIRSFSDVSAPIFVSKHAFYSISKNLQDSCAEILKFGKMLLLQSVLLAKVAKFC